MLLPSGPQVLAYNICSLDAAKRAKDRQISDRQIGIQNLEEQRLFGVLIFVNLVALAIGFAVELALVLLGQVSVVLGHVRLFVVLQALFAALQVRGLSRRQLVVLHAIGDAVLLVLFPLVDLVDARMAGIDLARTGAGSVLRLSSG